MGNLGPLGGPQQRVPDADDPLVDYTLRRAATATTDRIELLRLEDGRIGVRRWLAGVLRDSYYCSGDQLGDNLHGWRELPVVLHPSAAALADELRAAGFMVMASGSTARAVLFWGLEDPDTFVGRCEGCRSGDGIGIRLHRYGALNLCSDCIAAHEAQSGRNP